MAGTAHRSTAAHFAARYHHQRKFEDPISLPSGKKLVTLRNAAD